MENKTIGEQRVRTDFNVTGSSIVEEIKQKSAELINILDAYRNDEVSKTYHLSPEALKQISGETLRLISIAQTSIEESCMWAVKAVTN